MLTDVPTLTQLQLNVLDPHLTNREEQQIAGWNCHLCS